MKNGIHKPVRYLATAAALSLLTLGGMVQPRSGLAATPRAHTVTLALSNSYIGNTWRVEMENLLKAEAAKAPYRGLVKLEIFNSGTDASAQISQMDDLIASHVDAILVDPASASALNPVISRAVRQGIPVIDFDQLVTSRHAYRIGVDLKQLAMIQTSWLAKTLRGKGNIILDRGIPGFSGDTDEYAGETAVLAKYPGIHVVDQVYGKWDEATAKTVMLSALAAYPHINGVVNQAGAYGATQAFLALHRPFVPMAGEASNGWRLAMATYKKQGLKGISVGDPPYIGALALIYAVALLQHQTPPASLKRCSSPCLMYIPIPTVTYDQVVVGKNAFQGVPPTFFADFAGPGLLHFTLSEALGKIK